MSELIALESEYAVLGTMLLDPQALFKGVELLKPEAFSTERHRTLFRFFRDLVAEGYPEELLTPSFIKNELAKKGLFEKVGGEEHLNLLVEYAAPSLNTFEAECQRVKEKALLRQIFNIGNFIQETIQKAPDPDYLLEQLEQKVFSLSEERVTNTLVPLKDVLYEFVKKTQELMTRREMVTGLPSGFVELDKMTSGFQPSDLIILAARPSVGKTAFALSIAYNVAVNEGKSVAIFSLEMSKEQLVARLVAQDAKISLAKIRSGFLNEREMEKIHDSVSRIEEAPIYIDDTSNISVLDLRAKAQRLKAEKGLDLIIVDYLQLMRGIRKTESRQQEVSEISRSLKILAKELGVPVIALSQLSRQVEHRADKRPQLSDLRESGSIEQDADVVMFIHRPDLVKKKPDPEEEGIAEIIIAKQRNGPTGTVRLAFIKEFTRFENLEEAQVSPQEEPGQQQGLEVQEESSVEEPFGPGDGDSFDDFGFNFDF
ncbi:replicative DNA helicase [Thermovibrio ammonificans]|uniref:Replicative DNA helicase n=1 Tax=Thermovibrio ammonificans (strain DSM 15698 / JCM 12110 / HB-1) TaxID=648996 RepID=E8T2Q1_THEA1|nr:replicative DNA helicase [Thermovibrio ammonificans]ADU95976.1 replicative DNA helicase [Thermovibrio ammonificans HB-1]